MTAIAGIYSPEKKELVLQMLDKMAHRGRDWTKVSQKKGLVLGMSGIEIQRKSLRIFEEQGIAQDCTAAGRYVRVETSAKGIKLVRDRAGIAPLYYGWTKDNELCFASEVKGLLPATADIHELPSGYTFDGKKLKSYFRASNQYWLKDSPEVIAKELRNRLEQVVKKSYEYGNPGSWLSGGLDSSSIAGIASQYDKNLHTFAAGLPGSEDLEYARLMADHIHSNHHELVVQPEDVFKILPEVIYYLESFDALLVRSSIFNFLVARLAANYISTVFSGEGSDELFAGYGYLKDINKENLPAELLDIIPAGCIIRRSSAWIAALRQMEPSLRFVFSILR